MKRCTCGFGEGHEEPTRHAQIAHGKLRCPYCAGEIVCETASPPGLRTSAEAYAMLPMSMRRRKQEAFWAFYLDARNRIIRGKEICRGTLVACILHPRDVFRPALTYHAAALIIAHNHPSGDPTPSPEDFDLTERLEKAGKLLGVPLLDHLVVGVDSYFSFRDSGKIGC